MLLTAAVAATVLGLPSATQSHALNEPLDVHGLEELRRLVAGANVSKTIGDAAVDQMALDAVQSWLDREQDHLHPISMTFSQLQATISHPRGKGGLTVQRMDIDPLTTWPHTYPQIGVGLGSPYIGVDNLTPDYGWAEVRRYSGYKMTHAGGYAEGLSQGMPYDCGDPYKSIDPKLVPCGPISGWKEDLYPGPREDVPYGVWFYPAPGSGIAVNVGRSLRLLHRQDTFAAMNSSVPYVGDRLFCTEAMKRGYDSIQWAQAFDDVKLPEMVICSGKAATTRVEGICPPMELKVVPEDKGSACNCDPTIKALNCGRQAMLRSLGEPEQPMTLAEIEKHAMKLDLDASKQKGKCPPLDDTKGTRHMGLVFQRQGFRDVFPTLHLLWDNACRSGKFRRCMYFCEQEVPPRLDVLRYCGLCEKGEKPSPAALANPTCQNLGPSKPSWRAYCRSGE